MSASLPAGASLASLLGSQADSFEQQLHAPPQSAAAGAPVRTASKAKKATGARSPALPPAASPVSLSIPFTHTLHPPQLLSSLLALTAPAATAAPTAGKHAASKASAAAALAATGGTPSSVAVVASRLQGSLSGAQALLAQLLPTSVEDTPKPKQFHALLLQYLEQCGTGLQINKESASGAASGEKKRKRGAAADSSAAGPSDSAIAVALHTVSTTVVGRLAARCIQMLSDGTLAASATSSGAFDSSLLRSSDSYWSILALLLRSDSLSARFTPSLFSLLTRHDALPLIESALVHMHDAAERDLVELTKYALDNLPAPAVSTQLLPLHNHSQQADDTQGSKKKRKKAARNMIHAARAQHTVHVVEVPGGAFAVILDLLLTSPLSATFLRHSLSSLSSSHAHKLIHYLYAWTLRYWLHTDSELHSAIHALNKKAAAAGADAEDAEGGVATSGPFRVPTLSQVIDWMNILLDAVDFMKVYNKEQARAAAHQRAEEEGDDATASASAPLSLVDLLSSLAAHISHHHLQFVEDSQDLKGFLSLFTLLKRAPNAAPLPQPPIRDYSCEIIDFGA